MVVLWALGGGWLAWRKPHRWWVPALATGAALGTALFPVMVVTAAVAFAVVIHVPRLRAVVAALMTAGPIVVAWTSAPTVPILCAVVPWVAIAAAAWTRLRWVVPVAAVCGGVVAWSAVAAVNTLRSWERDSTTTIADDAATAAEIVDRLDGLPVLRGARHLPGFDQLVAPWTRLTAAARPGLEVASTLGDTVSTDDLVVAARSLEYTMTEISALPDDPHWGWLVRNRFPFNDPDLMARATTASRLAVGAAELQAHLDDGGTLLVVALNPAEARAAGGLPGGYALIGRRLDRWELRTAGRVEDLNRMLTSNSAPPPDHALHQFVSEFGRFGATQDWRNVTMSPDAVASARAAQMLADQSGVVGVTAVALIDPLALATLMDVLDVEAVTLPTVGATSAPVITADTVVSFIANGQYQYAEEFPSDQRDLVLVNLMASLFTSVVSEFDLARLSSDELREALDMLAAGHLTVVAADPTVDHWLSQVPWVRGFDMGSLTEHTDVMRFGWTNAAGNKLDWFTTVDVDIAVGASSADEAQVQVQVDVDAFESQPQWVLGLPGGEVEPGRWRSWVTWHSTRPVVAVTVNGVPVAVHRWDGGVVSSVGFVVDVAPGDTAQIDLVLGGVAGCSRLEVWRQPAFPQRHSVQWRTPETSNVVEQVVDRVDYSMAGNGPCRTISS